MDEVLACLRQEYSDPVAELCALLDLVVPHDHQWEDLDHECRRAVEALIALGSLEGHRYLLGNIGLVCWLQHEPFAGLIHPQRDALCRAAADIWDVLRWSDRAILVIWFAEQGLPTAGFAGLLLAVDDEALSVDDRIAYVHALSFLDDMSATLRMHHLLDRALDTVPLTEDHKRFVIETMICLGAAELTPRQCQRAEECGVLRDAWNSVH
jgi:hypothetical protein